MVLGAQWNHLQGRSSSDVRGMAKAVFFRWEGQREKGCAAYRCPGDHSNALAAASWCPHRAGLVRSLSIRIIGRRDYRVQPVLGRSCLLYCREHYGSYLDHFYRRNHFFPRVLTGSREQGKSCQPEWGYLMALAEFYFRFLYVLRVNEIGPILE